MSHYFGSWVMSQLGFLSIVFGALIGGFAGYAIMGGRVVAGCVAGVTVAAVLFEVLFRRWIKARDRELGESHREAASNREREFQRKLAEAKANGTLDRKFGE